MNPWSRWVEAWAAEERGTSLAVFRMVVATVMVFDALSILVTGVWDPLLIPVREGGLASANGLGWSPLFTLLGHSSTTSIGLCWAQLVFGLLSLIGLGGRVTNLALLQVLIAIQAVPAGVGGSYDKLMTGAVFLMVLGNTTATLSADCRLRHGAWTSDALVYAFPRYLGIVQIAVLYTATGVIKAGAAWQYPYYGVFRALQTHAHMRFENTHAWLGWLLVPSQIGTAVAVYWERSFFILLPWLGAHLGWLGERARKWSAMLDPRPLYLALGVITHGVLAVMLNLGTFSTITMSFYVLFYGPESWERLGRRLLRR